MAGEFRARPGCIVAAGGAAVMFSCIMLDAFFSHCHALNARSNNSSSTDRAEDLRMGHQSSSSMDAGALSQARVAIQTGPRDPRTTPTDISVGYDVHESTTPVELQKGRALCVYTITTTTGKNWSAGTDSTISLRLVNAIGQEVYFPNLDNAKNNFEKGHLDTFQETGDCVDNICKMVLYTDNSGFMPGWFVDSLGYSVTTPAAGPQAKTWALHEWLPKTDSTGAFFDIRDTC